MSRAHWRRSRDGGEYTARLGTLVLRVWRCPTRWAWEVRVDGVTRGLRWIAAEHTRRGALRMCERGAMESARTEVALRRVRRLRCRAGST